MSDKIFLNLLNSLDDCQKFTILYAIYLYFKRITWPYKLEWQDTLLYRLKYITYQ
jgi:hypothetical protein